MIKLADIFSRTKRFVIKAGLPECAVPVVGGAKTGIVGPLKWLFIGGSLRLVDTGKQNERGVKKAGGRVE